MKALIIAEKNEIRDLAGFYLEGAFQIKVKSVSNFEEALVNVDIEEEKFDWIICSYQTSAQKLIALTLCKKFSTQFICFNSFFPDDPFYKEKKNFVYFVPFENWILETDKIFRQNIKNEDLNHNYCSIRLNLLTWISPLPIDLFSKEADGRMSLAKPAGLDFSNKDLDYFTNSKKLESLYLQTQYCTDLAHQIFKNLLLEQQEETNTSDSTTPEKMGETLKLLLDEKNEKLEFLKLKLLDINRKKKNLLKDIEVKNEKPPVTAPTQAHQAHRIRPQIPDSTPPQKPTAKTFAKLPIYEEIQLKEELFQPVEKVEQIEANLNQNIVKKSIIVGEDVRQLTLELKSIHSVSSRLGFNEEVQELTKKSVSSTIEKIKQAPKLSSVLLRLEKEQEKYISSHSILLAFISCGLASLMDWNSDTTSHKLTLAAFLHDITLSNHDLASIQTLPELRAKEKQFSVEEMRMFHLHATDAALVSQKFDEIPADVDLILAQHHERPDGSGFPKGLTYTRISPLSVVFIIAHDLVNFLFGKTSPEIEITQSDLERFVKNYPPQYKVGNFKRILGMVTQLNP